MSVSITTRPISGNYSYVASENPIVYSVFAQCDAIDRPKYYIEFTIREVASGATLGKMKVKPSMLTEILTLGVVTAYSTTFNLDVSQIVKQYLQAKYIDSASVNNKNTKSSLYFYVTYQEWVGVTPFVSYTDEANPITAVQSARQFENLTNVLTEYTPTGSATAKFLTKFKEPKRYAGYPFSISFLYSNALAGAQLIKVEQELDINRTQFSNTETQLITTQRNGVNNLRLKASFASNAQYDRLFLKVGTAVTDGYVDAGYVDAGYTV